MEVINAIGRRKSSVARVYLSEWLRNMTSRQTWTVVVSLVRVRLFASLLPVHW